jgi:hypothetical protein
VLTGLTVAVPLIASGPVQPPLAEQEVAFIVDQVNVVLLPTVMLAGAATKLLIVGG